MSGRMALSVTAVSIRVSPFVTEDVATFMFMTSALRRLPAISNDDCVRVDDFKEEIDQRSPGENFAFPAVVADVVRVSIGEVEKKIDLVCRQTFASQQMAARKNLQRVGIRFRCH